MKSSDLFKLSTGTYSISNEGFIQDIIDYYKQPNGVYFTAKSSKYDLNKLDRSWSDWEYYIGFCDDYKENHIYCFVKYSIEEAIRKYYSKKPNNEKASVCFNNNLGNLKIIISKNKKEYSNECEKTHNELINNIKSNLTKQESTLTDYFRDGKIKNISTSLIFNKYICFHKGFRLDQNNYTITKDIIEKKNLEDILEYGIVETIDNYNDFKNGFGKPLMDLLIKEAKDLENRYATKGKQIIQDICTQDISYCFYPKGSDENDPKALRDMNLINFLNKHRNDLEKLIYQKEK